MKMNRWILCVGVWMLLLSCTARADRSSAAVRDAASADTSVAVRVPLPAAKVQNVQATATDKKEVEKLLGEMAERKGKLSRGEIILTIARRFIGVPYVAHTLDRNKEEMLVVNLHQLDCTTYVENVVALSRCVFLGKTSFSDYLQTLQEIRYRGGEISYANRLHYYQWWVEDNERMGIVREIDAPNPPFSAVQTLKINYMSENFTAYDMLKTRAERVREIKRLEDATNGKRVNFIPKSSLKDSRTLRSVIKDGDIIALVTNKKNLDTTHLGIAVWHRDGLYLLNASSLKKNGKSVVEPTETLYDYLRVRPVNTGIRVARIMGD